MPRAFARGILIQILMDGRAEDRARAIKAPCSFGNWKVSENCSAEAGRRSE